MFLHSQIYSTRRISVEAQPSETRVHRRSLHVVDGGIVGDRRKHSLRMSCDFDLQQQQQQPRQHQQQQQLLQQQKQQIKPSSTLITENTILKSDEKYDVDDDEDNVERCRKDSGINSSSKVSSDADQSSGANALLSDQEAGCCGRGGGGDPDGADNVSFQRVESQDKDEHDKSSKKRASLERKENATSKQTMSQQTTSSYGNGGGEGSGVSIKGGSGEDLVPALPRKEGKNRSRIRVTRFDDDGKTTSFDSVSSVSASGGGGGGGGGGSGEGSERPSGGESSEKERWDRDPSRERNVGFTADHEKSYGPKRMTRNYSGDSDLVVGARKRSGGGSRLRGVGGGSFETGSVGNLLGVTGVEIGSRLGVKSAEEEAKSRSVGNVYRRQFRDERRRDGGGNNFEELDFRSEAAVRLFQSCCDDNDDDGNRGVVDDALSSRQRRRQQQQQQHQESLQQYRIRPGQRRITNQASKESQSSDCISGSSLARILDDGDYDYDDEGGGGRGGGAGNSSTLSSYPRYSNNDNKNARDVSSSSTSRPLLRLNSDEGPQPASSSSTCASLSRLCSSQEVVGARLNKPASQQLRSQHHQQHLQQQLHQHPKQYRTRSIEGGDASDDRSNKDSSTLVSSEREIHYGHADGDDDDHVRARTSTTTVQFRERPKSRQSGSMEENRFDEEPRTSMLRKEQHHLQYQQQLQQQHKPRPKEYKRRSNPDGAVELPTTLLMDSSMSSSRVKPDHRSSRDQYRNSKNNNNDDDDDNGQLRSSMMTSSVPASLPLVCSSSSALHPPLLSSSSKVSPMSSALHVSANIASSPANNEFNEHIDDPSSSSKFPLLPASISSSSIANKVAEASSSSAAAIVATTTSTPRDRLIVVPSSSRNHHHHQRRSQSHQRLFKSNDDYERDGGEDDDDVGGRTGNAGDHSSSITGTNIMFSSSHVSEEDLAERHRHFQQQEQLQRRYRHREPQPRRHYHLSTSSPTRPHPLPPSSSSLASSSSQAPPPNLTNGFTSAYLLDESADSPSSLFLGDDGYSRNDSVHDYSWRRSLDM